MTTNTKERRPRVFTTDNLPVELRENGYVADLVGAVKAVADQHRAHPVLLQKNGDWYMAILLPSAPELAEIDKQSPADAG